MLIITIIKQASFSIMSYLQVHWLPHVSISLLLSLSFKWSRSVKDNYMRGKANLKKFFSESFCKLGEKKKKKNRSKLYSTSPTPLILHFLPVGFYMDTLKFLSKSSVPPPHQAPSTITWTWPGSSLGHSWLPSSSLGFYTLSSFLPPRLLLHGPFRLAPVISANSKHWSDPGLGL